MAKKTPSPTFEPIKPTRAHEAVLAQLQRKILEGELAPGDRLPSEREMMDTFGVSWPTVREALRVAESLGLAAVRHGDPGGPRVLGQPSVGVTRVLDGLLSAERTSVAELLEARMVLEGAAARLAAQPGAESARWRRRTGRWSRLRTSPGSSRPTRCSTAGWPRSGATACWW